MEEEETMAELRGNAGSSIEQNHSLKKAMGEARYLDDLEIPRLVYGAILRSPHALCTVLSIDVSQAAQVDGFLGVLLPEEVPQRRFNCSGNPPSPLLFADELILTRRPLYAGDRIAAVAAKTKEACLLALAAIKVEYEVERPLLSIKEALAEGATPLHPEMRPDNELHKITASQGDVERGFAESDFVLEGDFATPAVQHVALEPTGCICDFSDGKNLTVWSTSQTPFQERRILSELFDLPETSVRFIKPTMGGGFGARQQLHNQHVGSLLSRKVRCPIKIINTREDEMLATATRHACESHVKMGFMNDGTIRAVEVKAYYNTGPYATHGPTVVAAASRKLQYNARDYSFEGYTVYTNQPVAGAMRGYGNPQIVLGRELLIERAARKLGMDPVALRLRNHVQVGGNFPSANYSIHSCAIEACAEEAMRIRARVDAERGGEDSSYAWGCAFGCHTSGPSSKEGMSSAIVMIADDGSVQLMIGSADIGQGSETVMSQIVAHSFGIPSDRVKVVAADTECTPYDTGTFASSQTYVCGNAVVRACLDVEEKLCCALASLHEVAVENICAERGCFKIEKGGKSEMISFADAVGSVSFGMKGKVLIGSSTYKAEAAPPPFSVCMARAERVDEGVRITDIIQTVDVGTAINPRLVEGQLEGGIMMGLGYALTESYASDSIARKTPSTDLLHYRMPTSLDMPKIHTWIADGFEKTGPLGAKSVGELSTVAVAPAIISAVEQLLSREINQIPLALDTMPVPFWSEEGRGKE